MTHGATYHRLTNSPGFIKLRRIRLVTTIVWPACVLGWVGGAVLAWLTESAGWAIAGSLTIAVGGGVALVADLIGMGAAERELDRVGPTAAGGAPGPGEEETT